MFGNIGCQTKSGCWMIGISKKKLKEISTDSVLWSIIYKRRGHTKINVYVKQALYNWVLNNTQVAQYPISNEFFKLSIDGQDINFFNPKLLFMVSVRELHNNMLITP